MQRELVVEVEAVVVGEAQVAVSHWEVQLMNKSLLLLRLKGYVEMVPTDLPRWGR